MVATHKEFARMPHKAPRTTKLEETIRLPLDSPNGPIDDSAIALPHPAVRRPAPQRLEWIESPGSLSSESNAVLRGRLRVTSILLAVGFTTLLVYRLVFPSDVALWWWLPPHIGVALVNAVVAVRLCVNCSYALRYLRLVELVVFGGTALYFAQITYDILVIAAKEGYSPPVVAPWMLLIFTYALLIPNSWQRAAAVIVPLAVAPTAVTIVAQFFSEDVAKLYEADRDFAKFLAYNAMTMGLATTIAVWGVHLIRGLRREAYEARQLGQYQLKRKLGKGGMGEVFLAEHVMLKRPCAIKLIRPEMAGHPETLARFEREVQSMARLTHWNTVEVFDYGRTEDGTFYYVMEYLPGMNLDQLIREYGPMPPARVVHLIAQTCEALEEAHNNQLIHRDIKPANIFAARRGGHWDVAKLLDFGLVRTSDLTRDTMLTQDGAISGSPLYMSPEQAMSEGLDLRTDIYSLGAVTFYLLSGRPPFEDSNPMRVILSHARDAAPRLDESGVDVPESLQEVVMRCLSKNREDRYGSARELRDALLACIEAGTWTRADAAQWWQTHGCPDKKRLDSQIFDDCWNARVQATMRDAVTT